MSLYTQILSSTLILSCFLLPTIQVDHSLGNWFGSLDVSGDVDHSQRLES